MKFCKVQSCSTAGVRKKKRTIFFCSEFWHGGLYCFQCYCSDLVLHRRLKLVDHTALFNDDTGIKKHNSMKCCFVFRLLCHSQLGSLPQHARCNVHSVQWALLWVLPAPHARLLTPVLTGRGSAEPWLLGLHARSLPTRTILWLCGRSPRRQSAAAAGQSAALPEIGSG